MKIILTPKNGKPAITLVVSVSPPTATAEIVNLVRKYAGLAGQFSEYKVTMTEN